MVFQSYYFLSILLLSPTIRANTGINCDFPENSTCLNVFDSEPAEHPKCYCTDLCPVPLETLKKECKSGQLLANQCHSCLECAKSRGEKCGGLQNRGQFQNVFL